MYPLEASKLTTWSMYNSKQMTPLSCFHCIRVLEMEKIDFGRKFSVFVAHASFKHKRCSASSYVADIDKGQALKICYHLSSIIIYSGVTLAQSSKASIEAGPPTKG